MVLKLQNPRNKFLFEFNEDNTIYDVFLVLRYLHSLRNKTDTEIYQAIKCSLQIYPNTNKPFQDTKLNRTQK